MSKQGHNPTASAEGGPKPASLTEAVVLAGGFGTRLRSVVQDLPKPMAPVGERPFLAIVLDELVAAGIKRCVLAVGYKADAIRAYFGTEYQGVELMYSVEEDPLGTGGGIRQAVEQVVGDACFVLNGDTLFRVDLADLGRQFFAANSLLTLGLKPMRDFDRYGTVVMDASGTITGFREKQPMAEGLINGGVYALHKALFAGKQLPAKFSFEQAILEAEVGKGRFHGAVYDAYFIDIGIPEDYARAQVELA